MNILFLCNYPLDISEMYGGTSTVAYNLVHSLLTYTDVNIATFTFVPNITKKEVHHYNKRKRVIRYPADFKYASILGAYKQKKVFNAFIKNENIDLIHSQCNSTYTNLAVNSKLPNVFTVHGIRLKEIEIAKSKYGYMKYILQKRIILENYRKAKNIVVTNTYTKNQIAPYHNSKIWEIPNPVDESYFNLYKKSPIEPGTILMATGIRRRKDIKTAIMALIEVINHTKKVKLVITGPIEEEYVKEISSLINDPKVKNNIEILGLVKEEELKNLYAICDFVLQTSIEETSPMAIIQAIAAGKPVITTDVGGISEILRDNENAFITPKNDYQSIANSILKLLENRKLRDDFAQYSYSIAQQKFSSKSIALQTYDMYSSILRNE